ncbi:hypothetical protein B0H10DRAFT_1942310 [Mycena sp. CBHHK59/15]|nr:hypothetical protein B0H10DRAFT_1942310 [Mycena sp. CBHHK59/15]
MGPRMALYSCSWDLAIQVLIATRPFLHEILRSKAPMATSGPPLDAGKAPVVSAAEADTSRCPRDVGKLTPPVVAETRPPRRRLDGQIWFCTQTPLGVPETSMAKYGFALRSAVDFASTVQKYKSAGVASMVRRGRAQVGGSVEWHAGAWPAPYQANAPEHAGQSTLDCTRDKPECQQGSLRQHGVVGADSEGERRRGKGGRMSGCQQRSESAITPQQVLVAAEKYPVSSGLKEMVGCKLLHVGASSFTVSEQITTIGRGTKGKTITTIGRRNEREDGMKRDDKTTICNMQER